MQCGLVPLNILTLFCARSSVEETEALFLLDSAKDISPHNYRTIALLNSFLAFFDSNFFLMFILVPPAINSTTSRET